MMSKLVTRARKAFGRVLPLLAVSGLALLSMMVLAAKPGSAAVLITANIGSAGVAYTDYDPGYDLNYDSGPVCLTPRVIERPWVIGYGYGYGCGSGYGWHRPYRSSARYWRQPHRYDRGRDFDRRHYSRSGDGRHFESRRYDGDGGGRHFEGRSSDGGRHLDGGRRYDTGRRSAHRRSY